MGIRHEDCRYFERIRCLLPWTTERKRLFHYQDHRLEVGAMTIDEYDTSANETIATGVRFEYIDSNSGLGRVGYFDRATELLTVLDRNELVIITHFKPDRKEHYVRDLPNSTYPY